MDVKAKFRGDLSFLSNMYPCSVIYRGVTYPSSEHAYQLQKMRAEDLRYDHMRMSPGEVKKFARQLEIPEDWESRKLGIMFEVLEAKFKDPVLRSRLLRTPDSVLVEENYWHDNFWGVCKCAKCGGHGENHLGKLLVQVHHKILAETPQ